MSFDLGTWIAIGAVLAFYLRLIILQRQKVKTYRAPVLKKGARKSASARAGERGQPSFLITNKLLAGLGVALLIVGAVMSATPALPETLRQLWWLPVTLGMLLMSLGIH